MSVESLLYAILIIIAAGYWFFFKKFFSELGKQTVELSTLTERTRIVEESQLRLAEEIEPIKAELTRKNIAFQVRQAEFERLRFERLDKLYAGLYDLQKYSRANLFAYAEKTEFEQNKLDFFSRYRQAEDAYYLSLLYLDDSIAQSALNLLNECFNAYMAFNAFYYSDQSRSIFSGLRPSESLREKNINSLDEFNKSIEKFPELLIEIRAQVHRMLRDHNEG